MDGDGDGDDDGRKRIVCAGHHLTTLNVSSHLFDVVVRSGPRRFRFHSFKFPIKNEQKNEKKSPHSFHTFPLSAD